MDLLNFQRAIWLLGTIFPCSVGQQLLTLSDAREFSYMPLELCVFLNLVSLNGQQMLKLEKLIPSEQF